MRADWYETRTPRRQTAFLPPVTTIWILQGSQCSPHFFLPKLNSIASVGWFKMQIRYSTNAPEDHNIILNPGFKICRLKEPTVLEGNSITLEHSPKHHLGTQPFLDSFGTQNDTFCLPTADTQNIKFIDRRSSLEASRVPAIPLPKKGANPRFCPYIISGHPYCYSLTLEFTVLNYRPI